jgi:hypothetical protein
MEYWTLLYTILINFVIIECDRIYTTRWTACHGTLRHSKKKDCCVVCKITSLLRAQFTYFSVQVEWLDDKFSIMIVSKIIPLDLGNLLVNIFLLHLTAGLQIINTFWELWTYCLFIILVPASIEGATVCRHQFIISRNVTKMKMLWPQNNN